jgi:hypothetical protein
MPDPWLTDEELKEHEKAVAEHPLTEEAKKAQQEGEEAAEELAQRQEEEEKERQEAHERAVEEGDPEALLAEFGPIQPAKQGGATPGADDGSFGPSGEAQAPPPAGNLESTEPTQEELEEAGDKREEKRDEKQDKRSRSSKKSANDDAC